jgi:hypothetical protein
MVVDLGPEFYRKIGTLPLAGENRLDIIDSQPLNVINPKGLIYINAKE